MESTNSFKFKKVVLLLSREGSLHIKKDSWDPQQAL